MSRLTLLAVACSSLLLGCCLSASGTAQPKPDQHITTAVEKGVAFLRANQAKDGWWAHHGPHGQDKNKHDRNVGATALCALALVMADVPPDDDAIKRAAIVVRTKAKSLTNTYAIACCILLLDRINKGAEDGMIRMLGDKLLRGQCRQTAGWEYHCPQKNPSAIDHSCTQFALLGLWTARRYGLKADTALRNAETRFRILQQPDGGWSYRPTVEKPGSTTLGMTCAGLMALAFGMGTRVQPEAAFEGSKPGTSSGQAPAVPSTPPPDPNKDANVVKGREFLQRTLASPSLSSPHLAYSLWSLERICLIYNYRTIDKVDWYAWGVNQLLPHQQKDGGWSQDGVSGRNAETAFALLFLRKADLAGMVLEATFQGGNLKALKPGPGVGAGGDRRDEEMALPKPEPGREGSPEEAASLLAEVSKARGKRLEEILELLEVTKGSEYTAALVKAVGQLHIDAKDKARAALARRFSRMTVKTLRDFLKDTNSECRLAALSAAGLKEEKELLPDLIPFLTDADSDLRQAAHQSLKKLSGRDYGRDPEAWRKWWATQKK
jgi:hypothetical protein